MLRSLRSLGNHLVMRSLGYRCHKAFAGVGACFAVFAILRSSKNPKKLNDFNASHFAVFAPLRGAWRATKRPPLPYGPTEIRIHLWDLNYFKRSGR